MSKKIPYHEIDKAVRGLLPAEEKVQFHVDMLTDEQLREGYDISEQATDIIIASEFERLITDIRIETQRRQQSLMRPSGVLLVLGLVLVMFWPEGNSEQNLALSDLPFEEEAIESPSLVLIELEKSDSEIEDATVPVFESNIETSQVSPIQEEAELSTSTSVLNSEPNNEELVVTEEEIIEVIEVVENQERQVAALEIIEAPCEKVKIDADFQSFPACTGESNGRIQVLSSRLSGGHPPYSYKLSAEGEYQAFSEFDDLNSGEYEMFVMDGKGCLSDPFLVVVPEKPCFAQENYSFNPEMGASWAVPVNDESAGELLIVNRQGLVVFQKVIGENESYYWNGVTTNGTALPMGIYIFTLSYNEVSQNGTINLIR